ncbi:dTMP kinase [Myxococcota bacterium]|nr:dTMP kinase [Myxococcota bacterium]MBU1379550.1 dTMP kinase [Myxococcota bacterium]MBU1495268.1 dTMP kinase [Myxococcota bacterium]
MQGKFIAVEGIDGSGTTTFINNVKIILEKEGYRVHVTCEPSSHPAGKYIRERLQDHKSDNTIFALLFAADRLIHYREEIVPALNNGFIVISDRYKISSFAYQGVTEDLQWVKLLNSKAPDPDLTLFIDVDPQEGDRRITKRGATRDVLENLSFQGKVHQLYLNLVKSFPEVITLDGNAEPDILANQGYNYIKPLIEEMI